MIVEVIHYFNPGWVAPKDTGKTWLKCVCAFHSEDHASAAVSYELDCYTCQACPARGNAVTLLMQQERISYRDAERQLREISGSETSEKPSPGRRHRPFGGVETRSGMGRPVRRLKPWSN